MKEVAKAVAACKHGALQTGGSSNEELATLESIRAQLGTFVDDVEMAAIQMSSLGKTDTVALTQLGCDLDGLKTVAEARARCQNPIETHKTIYKNHQSLNICLAQYVFVSNSINHTSKTKTKQNNLMTNLKAVEQFALTLRPTWMAGSS